MRKFSVGLALLFLLQLGVSIPPSAFGAEPVSGTSKPKKSAGQLPSMTPQSVGDEIVKFFGRKTGKELMAEKAGNVTAAGAAAVKALAGESSSARSSAASKSAPVPPPPSPRVAIPQIRQEIQKILELNKKIQSVQSGRSVQLQRVQEQARIHQKILTELEASQKQTAGQKIPEKSTLLAQEKLRIIHEETQRNAQVVDALKEIPSKPVAKAAAKTVAKPAPKTDAKAKIPAS